MKQLKDYEYYRNENGVLYCGYAEKILPLLKEKVDLCVTSPPYDDLRNYEGYSFDFESIANKLYSKIVEGGVIVWVVGDATINGSETGTSFKQALYFKDIGLNLHDTMIYEKQNYVPLTHNRYEQAFEYMFIFSNKKPKTFNPIKEKSKYVNTKKSYSYISATTSEKKSAIRSNRKDITFVNENKIKSNIWAYKVGSNQSTKDKIAFQHPAIFPEKLAADHIQSWTNKNDIVLDCLSGSGTTLKMAEQLNRRWIGIEQSEKYCEIAKKRIENEYDQFKMDFK